MTHRGDIRRVRKSMGYDGNPPRCETCDWFRPLVVSGRTSDGRKLLAPSACAKGDFSTTRTAVCDEWTHLGETLDD